MKLHNLIIIPVLFGIVFADVGGLFVYSDFPFVLVFLLYLLCIYSMRLSSKATFGFVVFFLVWMGLSYIPTGSSVITERIGEWFYIFFVFGIVQQLAHTHQEGAVERRNMKAKNSQVNWDIYYGKYASFSDRQRLVRQWESHSRFYSQWLSYIHARVSIYRKNLRVFEIGSGLGGVLALLQKYGVRVTGSDISKKAAAVGSALNPKVKYTVFNIQTMKFPRGAYDRILAFEVLEHLDALDKAISSISYGLKRGGYFIGTSPYPYKKHIHAPTHINVLHPNIWRQLFLKHGFREVMIYPMSLPPLLWRIHPRLNVIFPVYMPLPFWIATSLIIAKK